MLSQPLQSAACSMPSSRPSRVCSQVEREMSPSIAPSMKAPSEATPKMQSLDSMISMKDMQYDEDDDSD